jgi:hypothetical protein
LQLLFPVAASEARQSILPSQAFPEKNPLATQRWTAARRALLQNEFAINKVAD